MKMRLERAFLLEQLEKHMDYNIDDSDRSSSPPPTPTDKPLRSKRSHRKTTPTGAAQTGGSTGTQHMSPGSGQNPVLNQVNPMSSAQSTPDPNRTGAANPFFNNVTPTVTSPHGVNGTSVPPLSLPPLQPQPQPQTEARGTYFDPTSEEQAPVEAQNGDSKDAEMEDAPGGFTAVNRQ
jgi:hypothetical protein